MIADSMMFHTQLFPFNFLYSLALTNLNHEHSAAIKPHQTIHFLWYLPADPSGQSIYHNRGRKHRAPSSGMKQSNQGDEQQHENQDKHLGSSSHQGTKPIQLQWGQSQQAPQRSQPPAYLVRSSKHIAVHLLPSSNVFRLGFITGSPKVGCM